MGIFDKTIVIRVKRQTQAAGLMQWLLLLPFAFAALTELLFFPNAIKYVCDLIWGCLLVLFLMQRRPIRREYMVGCLWIVLFLLYTLMVYVVNYQSALYYLWGIRNNFRFYVAFFAFALFLKETQVRSSFRTLDILFWCNFAVSVIQYYGFGIMGDYLGGLFGSTSGCNAYSVVFFSVVITKSVVYYLENQERVWQCMLKCAAAMCIAALAELKFFFVVFVVIMALAVFFTEASWRKFALILAGSIGVAVGVFWLAQLFGNGQKWFTIEWMLSVVASDKGYTSSGDLNRLIAIPQINELWLKEWYQRIFGMGLGNCETASYEMLNTPFFRQYGDMHYTWMSYAMMYLETGYMGLMFYFGFFVLAYLGAWRIEKRSTGMVKTYCRISRIVAILCLIISVYNSSLRMESGYMAYFVLAIPFALGRQTLEKRREELTM